jgi:hypothetical protein
MPSLEITKLEKSRLMEWLRYDDAMSGSPRDKAGFYGFVAALWYQRGASVFHYFKEEITNMVLRLHEDCDPKLIEARVGIHMVKANLALDIMARMKKAGSEAQANLFLSNIIQKAKKREEEHDKA